MSPVELTRKSFTLTDSDWQSLDNIAADLKAFPPSGTTAGQPSWRSLIKEISRGDLIVIRAPQPEPTDTE